MNRLRLNNIIINVDLKVQCVYITEQLIIIESAEKDPNVQVPEINIKTVKHLKAVHNYSLYYNVKERSLMCDLMKAELKTSPVKNLKSCTFVTPLSSPPPPPPSG